MRILGKGKTANAIKSVYKDAKMFDDNDLQKYDKNSDELTVVSPGIPPHNLLVQNTKNLISEYDLFYKYMPFTIWISGTNGKTTTTQMLQYLLGESQSQSGGNIGMPLAHMDATKKIWILETSSFTLHYTNQAKPNIYILLPISDDHLTWHGTFEAYKQAKLQPLTLMSSDDIAIIPEEYSSYKTEAKVSYYKNTKDLETLFNLQSEKINFKEPFLMDAILAMGVAKILNKRDDYTKINSFIQDAHKLEEFTDYKQRIWVDDSKATNIDATLQALKAYKEKKIHLILGGDDKGANLLPLFDALREYDIDLYLIGKNSTLLQTLAQQYKIPALQLDFLENAINAVDRNYTDSSYGICLLSPAAASLDQFNSYKERGEKFKEFVNLLKD